MNAEGELDRLYPLSRITDFASEILAENVDSDFVYLQMLNIHYLELTLNWICNVKNLGETLSKTMFVVTDQETFRKMTDFSESALNSTQRLNIVYLKLPKFLSDLRHIKKPLIFGKPEYFSYMKFRTNMINSLLESNISMFLIEADHSVEKRKKSGQKLK